MGSAVFILLKPWEILCILMNQDVFFFQAEVGIRGGHVTGVQTCALPISPAVKMIASSPPILVAYDPMYLWILSPNTFSASSARELPFLASSSISRRSLEKPLTPSSPDRKSVV